MRQATILEKVQFQKEITKSNKLPIKRLKKLVKDYNYYKIY